MPPILRPVEPVARRSATLATPSRNRSPRSICAAIVEVVANSFALEPATLFSRTRAIEPALARQTAMYLAHTVFGLSFGEIGRAYGRDRTTVTHACQRIEDARDNPAFDERLRHLEQRCRAAVHASPRTILRVVR